MGKQGLSVVIPAYNEAGAVGAVVSALHSAVKGSVERYEIIVVNDASEDETGDEAAKAGAVVVRNIENMGYGYSIKRGIKRASFDTILIVDADGTYPESAIGGLLEKYYEGFDMVVGARSSSVVLDTTRMKGRLRCLLKALVEFTAGRSVPDVNSGMRLFSKKTVLSYLPRLCDTFSFTTSLTLSYLMTRRSISYVQIDFRKRVGCSKVKLFRDSLRTMQFIVEAIAYYNPIKAFCLVCIFLICLSVAGLTAYLLGFGDFFAGFASSAFLCSAEVFSIGLLAVLIKQRLEQGVDIKLSEKQDEDNTSD